ncbi:hypothetical protein ACJ41O_013053 [Fusarium nematophilum]
MSQTTGNAASGQEEAGTKPINYATVVQDCALLAGDRGPVIASGKNFGLPSKLGARICSFQSRESMPWLGFFIDVPLGTGQTANEESGFGVHHRPNRAHQNNVEAVEQHGIIVKFPKGAFQATFEEAPESIVSRFPNAKGKEKGMTLVTIRLAELVIISRFGVPIANSEDPEVEGWIRDNRPIVQGYTLQDFLRQEQLQFVSLWCVYDARKHFSESRLPPPFEYPYGSDQSWDLVRFKDLIAKNKGHQFMSAFSDVSHLTAVTQSVVQDVIWLDDVVAEIAEIKFPAYFVQPDSDAATERFYAIVAMPQSFRDDYDAAWRRLIRSKYFRLRVFNSHEDEDQHDVWDCKAVTFPNSGIEALKSHHTGKYELVLQFHADLEECKRKVKAVELFDPDAEPSNIVGCGLPTDLENNRLAGNLTEGQQRLLQEVEDRMDLHRAILRGEGFWNWMNKGAAGTANDDAPPMLRPLPTINFLDIEDEAYADAIVEEALPQDRARFRRYLSDRPLGLGLIAAGPGFGKTTAGAAATLAMQAKLGKILCSGPTNVAIDNLACRLDERSRAVVDRRKGMQATNLCRRRMLVVRAYKPEDEFAAFLNLLKKPLGGDQAAPSNAWRAPSKWRLNLSTAFWLLVLLRSPAPARRQLHPDDSEALHEMQWEIDRRDDLSALRDLAVGALSWEQFEQADGSTGALEAARAYLSVIVCAADMLCATPAVTQKVPLYRRWKNDLARGLAVDEAANMNRADLFCVWGNTLLPCFLFGDPKQLPPTVVTVNDRDKGVPKEDPPSFVNRFAIEGRVSALEYLQGEGFPVYRLKTQLRMARGMFDTVASIIYLDVPFDYDPACAIENPEYQIGRDLEAFTRAKFPELAEPQPAGTLKPIFVHCENSRVFTDDLTLSKRSPDQVKIALDFVAEFIEAKKVDPARVVIISPYAANVQLVRSRRARYPALKTMGEAVTVDSFQGHENDVVIVVMSTAHPRPGPGFTSNAQRLNVLLTRQRCGLVSF